MLSSMRISCIFSCTSARNSNASTSGKPAVLARGVQRRLEEIDVVDARDLHRVLEAEEHALARALLGGEREQVAALKAHACPR